MIYVRIAVALGFLVLCVSRPGFAADFTLQVTQIDSESRPTLSLSGLTAGRYILEASTDLRQWFTLGSEAAGVDPVNFLHSEAPTLGTVFYRGRQVAEVMPIISQVDSNSVATGLVTIQNGGSLVLTNEAGVRYAFTVGASNVTDTVAVRLLLVTNFISFPYPNELRTAVLFEPSGFEFHGAGLLEITFPTNLPHLKLSSFAYNADGLGFHLTPDVISTNRVRIPVTHFSGVGTGLWAPTHRTAAVTTFIESSLDRLTHNLGGILGLDRNRMLLGEEPDGAALAQEFQSRQQEHFDHNLKPFFAEAEKDCALSQALSRHLLAMERQGQLLGIVDGPATSFLGSETARKWTCNCLQEAINACKDGRISEKTLLQTLRSIERQSQLRGGGDALEGCGLGSIEAFMEQARNGELPCVREWFGVISYSDSGSRTWNCASAGDITCTASSSAALTFEADIETVTLEDESFPPFFSKQTWTCKLFPQASGSFSQESISVHKLPCGATTTTTHRKTGAKSGPLDLQAIFVFEDGELTEFTIDTVPNGDLALKTTETSQGVTTPCDDGGTGSSNSYIFHDTVSLGPQPVSIEDVIFTKRTPVTLEGTVHGTRINVNGISMPFSWKFSLHRNGS